MSSQIIPLLSSSDFIARPQWEPLPFAPLQLKSDAKILILKLSAIGDCLVVSPVARALRQRYPQAHIAWAVQSKARTVVEGNPNLDEVLVWSGGFGGALELAKQIRARKFDAVLDLQGAFKSAPIVALSGAKHRIVSSRGEPIAKRFANVIVPMPSPPPHASEQYLRVAMALDISADAERKLQMPLSQKERDFATEFLAQNGFDPSKKLIGLNLGAARPIKMWPAEKFADLGNIAHQNDVQTILFGGPTEVEIAQKVNDAMTQKPIFAAGKTSLKQLGALIERCNLMVSGDTGPMHISAGVGTPILALFGPTDPFRTGPVGNNNTVVMRDLPCRPCFQKPTCERFECLSELEAAEVWPIAVKMLS